MKIQWSVGLLFLLIFSGAAKAAEDDDKALIMLSNKHEQKLKLSSSRSKDGVLEAYIRDMTCRIAAQECSNIRVYLLRSPGLNAFMMPNGAMFVQTGLILRATSASELATVIGHEIIHYTQGHSLERVRKYKKTQQTATLLNIGLQIGGLHNLASELVANVFGTAYLGAYSREGEKESDNKGLELMNNAGYDATAASRFWSNNLKEYDESGHNTSIFASHPAPAERMAYLQQRGEVIAAASKAKRKIDENRLLDLLEASRLDLLNDEMRTMEPKQFEALIGNQRNFFKITDGMSAYLNANAWMDYSKKKGISDKDLGEALNKADFRYSQGAESESGMPSAGYREWAKLSENLGHSCQAKTGYERYIEREPEAWDVKFIKRRLGKVECNTQENNTTSLIKNSTENKNVPAVIKPTAVIEPAVREDRSTIDKFQEASSKCLALGFKKQTESFGECILEFAKTD